jgi:feruloyl-CoA synthase
MNESMSSPFRSVNIASWDVCVEHSPDGSIYMRPSLKLAEYPTKLTDRLDEWAAREPSRVFLAQRKNDGNWRTLGYAEFRASARAIAQALLNRGLSVERPVAVLSGNDIEHALIEMGAMYAGIPYSPVSPAYSLLSSDFGRLRHVFRLLTPGLVFAADGEKYRRAIEAVMPSDATLVVTTNRIEGRATEFFSDLAATPVTEAVDKSHRNVTADIVAKILFTSGSSGIPKGVINTHRMLCSNQEMLRAVFRIFAEEPPVVCDWLPWHHTFGGNHNFGLVLYNGGSLYIDGGKAVTGAFEETTENLREISPTVYFNVPKGYEMLTQSLREDTCLRESFFRRLKMNFYAAASLPQYVWDELDAIAVQECGERIRMLTGLGMTETSPFAISAGAGAAQAGYVGLPVPGVELKLTPVAGKMEVRYRGPNVTSGFWRQEDLTRAAFDAEGFFRSGDAVRFFNPALPAEGLIFDGRLAEDFKLSTGTWVSVGPLRARFISHCAPYVKDVVIAGHDRDEVTALIFADKEACACLTTLSGAGSSSDAIRAKFRSLLASFAASGGGRSQRIERAILLEEPPSLDAGEITDKGSINQRAVLAKRAALVRDLYASPLLAHVISIRESISSHVPEMLHRNKLG